MNKLFKRTTAFVLMVCLLCALAVPAVYAAPAEATPVVYDFELDQTDYKWNQYYFGGTPYPQTNSTAIEVVETLYATGELNWSMPLPIDEQEYEIDPETGDVLMGEDRNDDGEPDPVPHPNHGKYLTTLTAMSDPHNANYFGGKKYNSGADQGYTGLKIGAASASHSSGACTMNANGGWNVLVLRAPAAGKYALTLEYTKYAAASSGTGVYLVPYTAELKAKLTADSNGFHDDMAAIATGTDNKLGSFSSWLATGSEAITGNILDLGEYTFSAAYDEYLLVLSEKAGKYAYIQNLTLTPVAEAPLTVADIRNYSLNGVVSANTALSATGVDALHNAYAAGTTDIDFIGTNAPRTDSNFYVSKTGYIQHYGMTSVPGSGGVGWDAYKLRSPGEGTFNIEVSTSRGSATKSSVWMNLYMVEYTEGMDLAAAIVEANLVGTHRPASTGASGSTPTPYTSVTEFTFGSYDKEYVLIMATNTGYTANKDYNTEATPAQCFMTANIYLNSISITGELAQAAIGDTYYTTMADAIAAAKSGDVIKLAADYVGAINLPAGVSLDLNGYTLDASTIVATNAAEAIIDSKGTGKLIAQDLDLFGNNGNVLPLQTAGNTYALATYELTVDEDDYEAAGSKTRFWFNLELDDAYLDMIAAGNSGLTIGVELAWGEQTLAVTFGENDDAAAFAAAWAAAKKGNDNIWLYVDIAGVNKLDSDLTVKPVLTVGNTTLNNGTITYTVG